VQEELEDHHPTSPDVVDALMSSTLPNVAAIIGGAWCAGNSECTRTVSTSRGATD
jgi:hypothetical protein